MKSLEQETYVGIVLKVTRYSESDAIITVLSQSQGMQKLFVKSGYKSQKRYVGILDLFAVIQYSVLPQKFAGTKSEGGLLVLQNAHRLDNDNIMLFCEPVTFAFMNYFAEACTQLLAPHSPEAYVYDLWMRLKSHITQRSSLEVVDCQKILTHFLDHQGYCDSEGLDKDMTFSEIVKRIQELLPMTPSSFPFFCQVFANAL